MKTDLPINAVLPALIDAICTVPCVVLSAAPGAGKTTVVPLALLQSGVIKGRIIMLEPRRLAAMRAAQYMALQLGEKVGDTVGYRIRGDSRVSAHTKIEVVTEGILARLIRNDPELSDIGLIIFDEFHERSLHADLGLALARDVQKNWRDNLKILVMSATLNGVAVSTLLDNAPIIESAGRSYPVNVMYVNPDKNTHIENQVAQTVMRALHEQQGDVLVFLPGQREIRRVQTLLENQNVIAGIKIHTLFGEASSVQQQAALQPDSNGARKIILSTSIAETSLTIDGVCVVVDAGLVRTVRFDPRRAMAGLITVNVSQATAEQRAGRAGRQQAGVCYRLWSESQHNTLARFPVPEILQSDLMPLALELAAWGADATQLAFLDAPPLAHMQQAREVLQKLGALDELFRITVHGRAMADLPLHPRYAHMLLRAHEKGFGALACDVAALLEERDLLPGAERDVDFYSRWSVLKHGGSANQATRESVKKQAARLRQMIGAQDDSVRHDEKLGVMLALCYPERVAKKRDASGERWQLASGSGATLPQGSSLARYEWITVAELDGEGRDARIFLAAAIDPDDLPIFLPEQFFSGEEIVWNAKEEAVVARDVKRFGAIVFSEKSLPARGEKVIAVLCNGLRNLGWNSLPLPDSAQHWLARARWLHTQYLIENFPDYGERELTETLEQWLSPFLSQVSRRSQLPQVDWYNALLSRLDYSQQQQMEQLAPTHLPVPTGTRVELDYSGEQPVLAVRLQEMFGAQETPRIAAGKIPVLVHLLSPKRSPLAVTQDLASFWQNAYKDVRKDMRGQYPKHYWPENPLEAEPTRRTKAADDRVRKRDA
ncbi:MAG TPA: ATP-dependent helicase HrpB [Pseudomonadales bacterium]|nr:ATP-dependent helicase HrpB [Pseudomonadales bacterium]